MDDFHINLGKTIAELRKKASFSQEFLAFECDLHLTYISQLERGLKSPTVRTLNRLADALKTTPSAILRKTEKMES